MKILIVKLGALGDVINTLPLALVLKQQIPDCHIDWVVEPLSFPVVSSHKAVNKAILFQRSASSALSVIRTIRNTRYDMVLDLQRILKSALFTLASRTGRRIGFDRERCKEMTDRFPFERIQPKDPLAHMLDQYLEFAMHLGLTPGLPAWNIPRTPDLPEGMPAQYVVLNIGATKPANLWAPKRFNELAEKIRARIHLPCIITGGPEDKIRAKQILDSGVPDIMDLTGATTIAQLIEVIGHARAVVSCDTGPMHLAAALDKPLVALFGPSDPRRTGPYQGQVIQGHAACAPCNQKHCPAPDCMDSISADMVMAELEKIIKG